MSASYSSYGGTLAAVVGTIAVSNVAQQVRDAALGRRRLLLYNNGSMTVYVGPADVLVTTGWPIKPGEHFESGASGALYVVNSTGTGDLRYWDEFKPS